MGWLSRSNPAPGEGLTLGRVDDHISARGPGWASRRWRPLAPEPDPLQAAGFAYADGLLSETWQLLTLLGLDDFIAPLASRPEGTRAIQLRQAVPDHLAVMIYDTAA